MHNYRLLLLLLPVLLQGCQTAPRAIVQAVCPSIPPLEQKPALQEPTFSDRIASFLQGKLPELINYDFSLSNAKLPITQPEKP